MIVSTAPLLLLLAASSHAIDYGVDISFPAHSDSVSTNYDFLPHNQNPSIPTPPEYQNVPIQPLGNRQEFYENMIESCVDYYGEEKGARCRVVEENRISMAKRQIQSMVNYTENGFVKIKTPEHVWKLIREFWDNNRGQESVEKWNQGNTHVNHWQVPTYLLNVGDMKHPGGGRNLKQQIYAAAKATLQQWTGQELRGSSMYGIRIYKEDAVLNTHVDRLPLISSAIINVDQDVDEPWPLEVIGHDGKAHNVTMEPGDMVLYESHAILHGRPFPLKGRFMVNLFVHFEPLGPLGSLKEPYVSDLPPYIIPGSPEEPNWRKSHPEGFKRDEDIKKPTATARKVTIDGNQPTKKHKVTISGSSNARVTVGTDL